MTNNECPSCGGSERTLQHECPFDKTQRCECCADCMDACELDLQRVQEHERERTEP